MRMKLEVATAKLFSTVVRKKKKLHMLTPWSFLNSGTGRKTAEACYFQKEINKNKVDKKTVQMIA